MNTPIINPFIDYYDMLGAAKQIISAQNLGFIYSIFAYGSAGRFEIMPESSDLDLIAVLKDKTTFDKNGMLSINSLISYITATNYHIPVSIHVWDYDELSARTSENEGTELTFSLSRFRDSIPLYGKFYDHKFIDFFDSAHNNANIISNDCWLRLSKIRYDIRRLVHSTHTNKVHASDLGRAVSKQMNKTAETICYLEGHYPRNSADAIHQADAISKVDIFETMTSGIKDNRNIAIAFELLSWLDSKIEYYFSELKHNETKVVNSLNSVITKAKTLKSFAPASDNKNEFFAIMHDKGISDTDTINGMHAIMCKNKLSFKLM